MSVTPRQVMGMALAASALGHGAVYAALAWAFAPAVAPPRNPETRALAIQVVRRTAPAESGGAPTPAIGLRGGALAEPRPPANPSHLVASRRASGPANDSGLPAAIAAESPSGLLENSGTIPEHPAGDSQNNPSTSVARSLAGNPSEVLDETSRADASKALGGDLGGDASEVLALGNGAAGEPDGDTGESPGRGGGAESLGTSGNADFGALRDIEARLQAAAPGQYPYMARRRGITGEAVVSFVIGPDGWARLARVVRSSGAAMLDEAAMRVVAAAGPFPAYEGRLTVPIRFELE